MQHGVCSHQRGEELLEARYDWIILSQMCQTRSLYAVQARRKEISSAGA